MKRLFSNKLNILLTLMLILILVGLIVLAINLMGLGHKAIIAEDFSGKTVAQVSEWISEKIGQHRGEAASGPGLRYEEL